MQKALIAWKNRFVAFSRFFDRREVETISQYMKRRKSQSNWMLYFCDQFKVFLCRDIDILQIYLYFSISSINNDIDEGTIITHTLILLHYRNLPSSGHKKAISRNLNIPQGKWEFCLQKLIIVIYNCYHRTYLSLNILVSSCVVGKFTIHLSICGFSISLVGKVEPFNLFSCIQYSFDFNYICTGHTTDRITVINLRKKGILK